MAFDLILIAIGVLIAVSAIRHALASIREGVIRFPYAPFPMEFTRKRDRPLFWGYVALDLLTPLIVAGGAVALLYVRQVFA